jgi:hypothetical protein
MLIAACGSKSGGKSGKNVPVPVVGPGGYREVSMSSEVVKFKVISPSVVYLMQDHHKLYRQEFGARDVFPREVTVSAHALWRGSSAPIYMVAVPLPTKTNRFPPNNPPDPPMNGSGINNGSGSDVPVFEVCDECCQLCRECMPCCPAPMLDGGISNARLPDCLR